MKAFIGFAGFGGVDLAFREFGIDVLGIEIDDRIAQVNRDNGGNVVTVNILDVDPKNYIGHDLCHFSPPCPNFSAARSSKAKQDLMSSISDLAKYQTIINKENETDIALSNKICQFIQTVRPEYFTLENVWLYRKSLSWLNIWYTLLELGYGVDVWNLNSADYGVPQTRKRMIAIARKDGIKPARPWPTHSNKPDMFTKPWIGWYEAIEDLIPELPETRLADWQIDRMSDELKTFLMGQGERNLPKAPELPADTITANGNQTGVKAFVIDCQNNGSVKENGLRGLTIRYDEEPIFTITASKQKVRVYSQGRWVSMTPRCLARLQSFPDWFKLPKKRSLACKGIGNAVPPLMYKAVLKSLLGDK